MTRPTKAAASAAPLPPPTPELVSAALACIPPDLPHDDRVRVFMAVYDGIGDAGRDICLDWAAGRARPDSAGDLATWKSVRKPGKVKVATLFAIAKEHGFRFPANGTRGESPSPAAAAERARVAADRARQQQAEAEQYRRRADKAALDAAEMWSGARVGGHSPYLRRKGVKGHGVRYLADGTLLVPMRDAQGVIQNLQRIAPKPPASSAGGASSQPEKRFMSGGRKSGLWHMLGTPEGAQVIAVAEGYATAATVHEATAGLPTAVAFDCTNLVNVARELRAMYPEAVILIAGDDDAATEARTGKNPGREKAATAARAVAIDGKLAGVVFPEGLPPGGTDWNDLAAHAGQAAVRAQIERAAACPAVPPIRRGAKAGGGGEAAAVPAADASATPRREQRASAAPWAGDGSDDGERPGARDDAEPGGAEAAAASVGQRRDPFLVDEAGVWFVGRDRDGNDKPAQWLSDPLYVTAIARDEGDNGYGYLIEFANRDGKHRTWAAPAALFAGDGSEWAARLRDMGLRMATGAAARNRLGEYIDSRNPDSRAISTARTGWHGSVFVLPSRCVGTDPQGRRFVYQSDSGLEDTFRQRGQVADWQAGVAAMCRGNSRLMFVVSGAFAGALVPLLGVATGAMHIVGDSSMGKTTALNVAVSVWGPPSFKQQWRATSNGLEGVCVQHNNCLLALDEISQIDSRAVGEAAYLIANETEKTRSSRMLLARPRRTWRLIVLSTGEKTLADYMAETGQRPNEGQLVRMPTVPADAGKGFGMFEVLHGELAGDGAAKRFADRLNAAAATHYGSAGIEWVEQLANRRADGVEEWRAAMRRYCDEWVPESAHAQVGRVAERFALFAVAGELATEWGITGWRPGEAEWAARTCFDAWLRQRGHSGNGVVAQVVRTVRAFLERNGEAAFPYEHRTLDDHRPNAPMRCGFRRLVDAAGKPLRTDAATEYVDRRSRPASGERGATETEYLVFQESFRNELCKGLGVTPEAAAAILKERGHLRCEPDRLTHKHRVAGMGRMAYYHVLPSIFSDDL